MNNQEKCEIILHECCRHFGQALSDIRGPDRDSDYVMPRHTYCYISRRIFRENVSLKHIGLLIRRDHSTVLHGIRKINNLRLYNGYAKEIDDLLDKCRAALKNGQQEKNECDIERWVVSIGSI